MAATGTFPYLVDPFRLGQVYGSCDLELERAVFAAGDWPPHRQDCTEDAADQALDTIINGGELSADQLVLYTQVLEHVCATLGATATAAEGDEVELLGENFVHMVNDVLDRLRVPPLVPEEYEEHPFLPGLGSTSGAPTIEVYSATECARVSRVLRARWEELTRNERALIFSTLRLLDKRRVYDALVLFSY